MNPHERLVEDLAAGRLDAQDAAHTGRCRACAALLAAAADAEADSTGLRTELLEPARRELQRPVRPWWVWAGALAAANAVLAAIAVTILGPWNWDVSSTPHWLFLSAATALAALVTAGVLLAFAPGRLFLSFALGLAALAPFAVLLAADGRKANTHFLDGTSCLLTVLALSVVPLAGGAWLLTQTAYSPRRTLALGLASAGVGLLGLQFHCSDGASSHLLAFHLLPWAVLGAAAVLLRRALPTTSHAP
jgi:Negative regulator of sigma F